METQGGRKRWAKGAKNPEGVRCALRFVVDHPTEGMGRTFWCCTDHRLLYTAHALTADQPSSTAVVARVRVAVVPEQNA